VYIKPRIGKDGGHIIQRSEADSSGCNQHPEVLRMRIRARKPIAPEWPSYEDVVKFP
jgi:hypothetical protein